MASRSPIPTAGWRTATIPDTQAWTESQNALTEALPRRACPAGPDPRAGWTSCSRSARSARRRRRAGRYFYQRRDGRQNQPVLYVREGVDGEDRVADRSQRARCQPAPPRSTGTIPATTARLLAYGLSENGSEQSVLHVLEVDSGAPLPDRIPRTRAADLAWLPDGSGLLLHPLSRAGRRCPRARSTTTAPCSSTGWAPIRRDDPLVFQPGGEGVLARASACRPTGAGCVIGVARTFDQTDLYLQDLRGRAPPPVPVAEDLPATFDGEVVRGRLFLRTNLDAPTYRLYLVDPERPARERLAGDRAAASRTPCSTGVRVAGSTGWR